MGDWEEFFKRAKKPESYDTDILAVKEFVQEHVNLGHNIALVTSGGTTVPLESRTVRFIDNFSVGTRGATSSEQFLRQGYAVLFLHRRGSLEPYRRHFMHNNFLDMLHNDNGQINIADAYLSRVGEVLQTYESIKKDNMLLKIQFTTLSDYLFYLRGAAQVLQLATNNALYYLAAAVSDFYIPAEQMPEHKIQSSDGPLDIKLQLVPKMLQPLISMWASKAFVVSFKLETDPGKLITKARQALERYNHQIVIGNILETRKREVIMVTKETEETIRLNDEEIRSNVEIEEKIIKSLIEQHRRFKTKVTV